MCSISTPARSSCGRRGHDPIQRTNQMIDSADTRVSGHATPGHLSATNRCMANISMQATAKNAHNSGTTPRWFAKFVAAGSIAQIFWVEPL